MTVHTRGPRAPGSQPPPAGFRIVVALGVCGWVAASPATPLTPPPIDTGTAGEPSLPAVVVKARPRAAPTELTLDPRLSSSTLGAARLERRQAASVFDVLDEVPGVSVNGGPRASGMSFNIRGYSDNEDIAVRVDGVAKGFEKYRFGGTFIEPDMLKTLEVRRGAQIESAGALGGTVLATTRDAADLLRPGQRLGARARLSWASNNHEQHRFAAVYGRPTDTVDLVAARSSRQGNELTLPDGSALSHSSVDAGSDLLKASWFPHDEWRLSTSWLSYHDQGLQAYDATGGEPGLFGVVQRRIDDDTLSVQAHWQATDLRHEARLVLGRATTRVRDHFAPRMSVFANAATGDVDDDIRYTGHTVDLSGRVRLRDESPDTPDGARLDLRMGLQLGTQARTATRVMALMPDRYSGGYNPAQVPGQRDSIGVYLQPDWRSGAWQVLPGLRWDDVVTSARGPTVDALQASGQPTKVRYAHTAPSLVVSRTLMPERVTVHAQWARAFRPPLIDELFSQSAYGGCNNASLSNNYTVAGTYREGTPGRWNGQNFAPSSAICADLYDLERSRSTEVGLSVSLPDVLPAGTRWQLRVTGFRNETTQLLESLQLRAGAASGVEQPGWERRHGVELETGLEAAQAFATLSYSRVHGRTFDGQQTHDLTTAPAARWVLSLGGRWRRVESVLRWQHVGQRLAVIGTDSLQRDVLGLQEGHRLLGLSVRWQASDTFELALNGENLENTRYRLASAFGGGIGTQAPGRNVRLSLAARY